MRGEGILCERRRECIVYTSTLAGDVRPPERRYACWGSFGPPVVSAQCPRDTVIQVGNVNT